MYDIDVSLGSNVILILVATQNVIECPNLGYSYRYVETNLRSRCAYHPRSDTTGP